MSSFHVSKASGPSVHIHVVLLGQSVSKNGQGVLGAHKFLEFSIQNESIVLSLNIKFPSSSTRFTFCISFIIHVY